MNRQWQWVQSHKKTVAALLAAVASLAVLGLWMVRWGKKEPLVPQEKVYSVRTFTAQPSEQDVAVKYTGLVQPQQVIQCYAGTVGTIEKLYVKEGDTVKKGQILAQLDLSTAQQQAQNTANMMQGAKNNLDSLTRARDQAREDYEAACDPASMDQLNQARAQRDTAQSELAAKQSELNRINGLLAPQEQKVEAAQLTYQTALDALTQAQQTQQAAIEKQTQATQAAQQAAQRVQAAGQAYDAAVAALQSASETASSAQAEVDAAQKALEEAATAEQQVAAQERLLAAKTAKQQADAALDAAQNSVDTAQAEQQAANESKSAADAEKVTADAEKTAADKAFSDAQNQEKKAMAELTAQQATLTAQQASLGKTEAQAAVSAAQTQLSVTQAAVDTLERKGETSEYAKLQRQRLEAAESALLQAQNLYNGVKQNHDSVQQAASNNTVVAPASGSIVKLMGAEGGLASPLAPLAVLAGTEPVVQFGVSQSDVRTLQMGMDAAVTVDGQTYAGTISAIALLPDQDTRTYPVSVSVDAGQEQLLLGSMAQVELGIGQKTGVWLPLTVIMNDGEDYVYIVNDGRALRRDIQIVEVSDDRVLVNGVDAGSQIISQGMKTVRSGSAVQILDEIGGSAE